MLRRLIPSPAMVVACIALLISLGGTTYAAVRLAPNSVGTRQLKAGAVTAPKVKRNSLTGAQINEGSLGPVPSATTAASASSADNATAASRAPLSRVHYESASVVVPNTPTRGTATCPSGLSAVGGGAKMQNTTDGFIIDTNPVGKTGWEATGQSFPAQSMTVYVICAEAASTTP